MKKFKKMRWTYNFASQCTRKYKICCFNSSNFL